jgi:hypothetical protein
MDSDLGANFEAGQTVQSPNPGKRGLELLGGAVEEVRQASKTKREKSKSCRCTAGLSCDFLFPLFGFWDTYL